MNKKQKRLMAWEEFIERGLPAIMLGMIALALTFLIASVAYRGWIVGNPEGKADQWASLGQLGDYFGGILNPGFALLAFIALMLSLTVQRIELRATMGELERSAQAMEEQASLLRKQAIDGTFFNLLKLHVERLDRDRGEMRQSGEKWVNLMTGLHCRPVEKRDESVLGRSSPLHELEECERVIEYEHAMFFINLTSLCRFVAQQTRDEPDRRSMYDEILRGTLDFWQHSLIVAVARAGSMDQLKRAVEAHGLLQEATILRNHPFLTSACEKFDSKAYGTVPELIP